MKASNKIFIIIIIISIIISILVFTIIIKCQYQINSDDKNVAFDPLYDRQWYLKENADNVTITPLLEDSTGFMAEDIVFNSDVNLGILEFWKSYESKNDKDLVIAILDSCVDIYHEDLDRHIWKNDNEIPDNGIDDDNNGYIDDYYGWNFFDDSIEIYSDAPSAEHGTHCAGIIAANHNGLGIMGILGNTNVKLMILPICEGGDICADDLVEAIKYADDMGADICNISAVVVDSENAIREAIHNSDMCFVVAAGNFQNQYITGLDLRENKRFPACCIDNRVITVGSTNEKNEFSAFSNYSPMYVDIAAPGEDIYSTLPKNNYGYRDGTSVASPIVAGILGAYYYCYTDTIEEAAKKLLVDSKIIIELREKVHEGRLVEFK